MIEHLAFGVKAILLVAMLIFMRRASISDNMKSMNIAIILMTLCMVISGMGMSIDSDQPFAYLIQHGSHNDWRTAIRGGMILSSLPLIMVAILWIAASTEEDKRNSID